MAHLRSRVRIKGRRRPIKNLLFLGPPLLIILPAGSLVAKSVVRLVEKLHSLFAATTVRVKLARPVAITMHYILGAGVFSSAKDLVIAVTWSRMFHRCSIGTGLSLDLY